LPQLARAQRNQGRSHPGEWLEHGELGYNYRLSEINCALGIEQMKRIESILKKRDAVAREYHRRLSGNPDLKLPPMDVPAAGSVGLFTLSGSAHALRSSSRYFDWIWSKA
jgi:dTDP-4-amino-4,6-dideoxygalactose transaminase